MKKNRCWAVTQQKSGYDELFESKVYKVIGKSLGSYFLLRIDLTTYLRDKGISDPLIFSFIKEGIVPTDKFRLLLSKDKNLKRFYVIRSKMEKKLWNWYKRHQYEYQKLMESYHERNQAN